MKKKIFLSFLLILILVLITGCGASNSDASKIRKFIKENMSSEWSYSLEKLKVKDDNSVEIISESILDWPSCAIISNNYITAFIDADDDTLSLIPKITITCKYNNIVGKAEYKNFKQITKDTIEENAVYYNGKDVVMTQPYNDAYKDLCKDYDFNELKSNNAKYTQSTMKFTGKVLEEVKNNYQNSMYVPYKMALYENDKETSNYVYLWIAKSAIPEEFNLGNVYTFYGVLVNKKSATNSAGENVDVGSLIYVVDSLD